MNGITLRKGVDYTVVYETEDAARTRTSTLVDKGTYRIEVAAVAGNGKYTGSWYSGNWAKGWLHVVDKYDFDGGSIKLVDGPQAMYTWTGGEIAPKVIVRNVNGEILVEGQDYELEFKRTSSLTGDDWLTSVKDEGAYAVRARGIGNYENYITKDGSYLEAFVYPRESMPHFYIAKPEHDLANAVVSMRTTFSYNEGVDEPYAGGTRVGRSLESVLKPVVTLGGVTLTEGYLDPDGDYRLFSTKAGWRTSGLLGEHTFIIIGNGDASDSCPYYGEYVVTYTVVDDTAPASDTRVDADTGVTVKGGVIADKSTTTDDSWVKLTVSEPEDDALENATASAKAAAEETGALAVEVFDVTLDVVDGDGDVTERLTSGFDITLTFPVDAKYNGHVATITQIHDGVALAPKTATVTGGSVSVQVDCLSQFVVAVEGEMATTPASEPASSSDADAAVTTMRPAAASAMPATGDALPLSAAMLFAVVAGLACVISQRFANR